MGVGIDVKRYVNYITDIILLLSIIISMLSGYILWFVLPRGIGEHGYFMCQQHGEGLAGNYYTFINWHRYTWIDIHNWASVILVFILFIHIILHRRWIYSIFERIKLYIYSPIKKGTEQLIVSILLCILFFIECLSGFVIWIIIPRGEMNYDAMVNGIAPVFWGLQRNYWVDIHAWIAVLIISIIAIHILFNWKWIIAVSKNIFKKSYI